MKKILKNVKRKINLDKMIVNRHRLRKGSYKIEFVLIVKI